MSRERVEAFVSAYSALRAEVEKVIVGHADIIDGVLTAMFAGGHVLLEGAPGLGKTLLVKTLAESLDLSSRAFSSRPTSCHPTSSEHRCWWTTLPAANT